MYYVKIKCHNQDLINHVWCWGDCLAVGGKKGFYVLIPQKIPMEVGEKKTDGEMEREGGQVRLLYLWCNGRLIYQNKTLYWLKQNS